MYKQIYYKTDNNTYGIYNWLLNSVTIILTMNPSITDISREKLNVFNLWIRPQYKRFN